MELLQQRILEQGENLGGGILKVDSFLNHRIDTALMQSIGADIAQSLRHTHPTCVLTAEVSGLPPACMTAQSLGSIPVIFARKKRPAFITGKVYSQTANSRTKGGSTLLSVAAEHLMPEHRVLIIDDFLATGATITALIEIIHQSGAQLVGIGTVVEKVFEKARYRLQQHTEVPIYAATRIAHMENATITFADDQLEE